MRRLRLLFGLLFLMGISSCGVVLSSAGSDGRSSATVAITEPKPFVSKYTSSVIRDDSGDYYLWLIFDCATDKRNTMAVMTGDKVVLRFENGRTLNLYTSQSQNGIAMGSDYRRFHLICPLTRVQLEAFLHAPLYSIEWENQFDYTELEVPLKRSVRFAAAVSEYVFRKKLSREVISTLFEGTQHTVLDESLWDY